MLLMEIQHRRSNSIQTVTSRTFVVGTFLHPMRHGLSVRSNFGQVNGIAVRCNLSRRFLCGLDRCVVKRFRRQDF